MTDTTGRPLPRQGVPQTPSPYPPDAADDLLADLLASFPQPIDFETSFQDHKSSTAVAHVLPTHAPLGSHHDCKSSVFAPVTLPTPTDTEFIEASPPQPSPVVSTTKLRGKGKIYTGNSSSALNRICRTCLVQSKPDSQKQSPSKLAFKRSTDAITPPTPTRPFKRLREALSPRSPRRSHAHSPSKIPLPKSPCTDKIDKALPRQPSELKDIITSFRYAQQHLVRTVNVLESFQNDIETERHWFAKSQGALAEMSAHNQNTSVALEDAERECARLRDDLARARADSGRAAQETQGMIAHLESTIVRERASSAALREQVNVLTERNSNMEQSTDRRVFQLTQDLDKARQETARAKGQAAEMRSQLDEAEFAHRALKEGGARLARELAEKDRKIEDLEKGKGRRWGMI